MAGTLSHALTKEVIKAVSAEVKKSTRLHHDIVMELILIQEILKETDMKFTFCPGYIQHLQVDPFGVHPYTETGLIILLEHLRKNGQITLFLDANDGVVQRPPNQQKRVLYYALSLPGSGKNRPPLPIAEMVTNDHTVLKLSTKIGKLTSHKIHQIETDYSWALIQGVLLAFNKQGVLSYLDTVYNVIKQGYTTKQLKATTVLHLCSAHILKAISVSFTNKVKDKGLKEFATHCVALMINSTSLNSALQIFGDVCCFYS